MRISKDSRALRDTEKQRIAEIVDACLVPLKVSITIPEETYVIHCRMHSGNDEAEWDEYFYHIQVTVDERELEIHISVDLDRSLFEFSWLIAWHIFNDLGLGALEHPAAKTLWGKRKELQEKYAAYTWGEGSPD